VIEAWILLSVKKSLPILRLGQAEITETEIEAA
jgi:hypothetical protein